MSRRLSLFALVIMIFAALLVVSACTAQQQAENQAINAVAATADAARLKVSQFVGYSQALIDQLAEAAGGGPIVEARANQIKFALDDLNAALQAIVDAKEQDRFTAMANAQDAVDKAIDIVEETASEATNPRVQESLNEMANELKQIREALIDLMNQESK